MRTALRFVPLLLVLAAAADGAAAAQVVPAPPAVPQGAGGNALKPLSLGEVQSIIDGYVIVQAEKALNLTEAQFPQFVTRLRVLQEIRRRNQRLHVQLIQEIARLTSPSAGSSPDEGQLREKLKALDDADQKSAAEVRKAYDSIDEILDVRQQARFRVFLDQVERRMLDILMRARAQAAPGAGRRGGRQ